MYVKCISVVLIFFLLSISSQIHPATRFFSVSDGFVILECEEPITGHPTGQVLLDYLTDSVLAHKPNILGKPAVSPDSRYLVTLDKQDTGVTLVVQEILRNIFHNHLHLIRFLNRTAERIFTLHFCSERLKIRIRRKNNVKYQRYCFLPIADNA